MSLRNATAKSLSLRIALTVFVLNAFYATTYLGNPMSKSMLDLTVSLVDRRALDIDPYAGNSTDVAYRNGHYYSGMPPGLSVLCVPYYLAAKTWLWLVATPERERRVDELFVEAKAGTWRPSEKHLTIVLLDLFVCIFGCAVLAGATAALFHRALGWLYPAMDERRRLATTWLFAFATLWFIYSPGIYHRVVSTALCFGAFALVLRPEGPGARPKTSGVLFGLALGTAVATTYEIALVAAVLAAFALARWGRRWPWAWTLAGAAPPLILLAAYHTACFGAPWATPYAMRIKGSVVPPVFRQDAGRPLLDPGRAAAFLFGSRYGFFFYSPILLLALPAAAALGRKGELAGPAAVGFSIFAVLIAFHYAAGYDGLPGEFGFRMMVPAIPFLALLVPASYGWSYRRALPLLAALSAVILGKGVMYGVHAGRPFWSNYPEFIARYGFANYTLANIKDHLWPAMSPWAISAIHLAGLGLIALFLRFFVWRSSGGTDRAERQAA